MVVVVVVIVVVVMAPHGQDRVKDVLESPCGGALGLVDRLLASLVPRVGLLIRGTGRT